MGREHLPLVKRFLKSAKKGDFLPRKKEKKGRLKRYLISSKMFILLAVDGEKIIGYHSYKIDGKEGELRGLGVLPDFRRKGIGRKLNMKSLSHMSSRGVKRVISKTWEKNRKSQGLLLSLGFKKYREIKKDRINGESTYWYRLNLK